MKKILLLLVLTLSLALTGCGDSTDNGVGDQEPAETPQVEVVEDDKEDKEPIVEEPTVEEPEQNKDEVEEPESEEKVEDLKGSEVEESEDGSLKTVEEYKEMINGDIGEEDTIENIELINNNIIITLDMKEHKLLSQEVLAESRYSSITDTLLDEGGNLNDITVKFINLGKVTMNTSQKDTNEYGDYFDSLDIQENFKYE